MPCDYHIGPAPALGGFDSSDTALHLRFIPVSGLISHIVSPGYNHYYNLTHQ